MWLENLFVKWKTHWMRPALVSMILLGGIAFAPLCLPIVICTHNTYFLWGKDMTTPEVPITIGIGRKDPERLYDDVQFVTKISGSYCMSRRRDMRVFIGRKPKVDLRTVWNGFKHFE